jgi:predicted nuclease with TOPRIM domain
METDSKLDKIKDDITDIKITLSKMESTLDRNTDSLEVHVKRTDLLEAKVELVKTEVLPLLPEIKQMVRWWKALSVVVVLIIAGSNPALIPILAKLIGIPLP